MPVAKYKRDEKTRLYYTYEKTGFYYSDGKPKYKKLRAKTIARLDEKVKAFNEDQALQIEPSKITVDDWEKQWFSSYKGNCRETTKEFYGRLYQKHIKPKIGMMRVTDVKEIHVQAILTGMSKTHGEKTIKSVRSIPYSLFEKAMLNRMISLNPARKLTAVGKAPKRRRELAPEERSAYLAACKEHEFGAFAALVYFFGLRRGEAAALRGTDIHPNAVDINKQHTFPANHLPKLGPPKTAAGFRDIVIPDIARQYIDFEVLRSKGAELLFVGEDGNALTHSQLSTRWDSFISMAFPNGTEITEHYLRHNYCVMLFEAEVDLPTVQRLMGHDSMQTTVDVYAHYTDKMKASGIKKAAKLGG